MLSKIFSFLRGPSEQEQMEAYFATAKDLAHLEYLQREWDIRKGFKSR